MKQTGRYLLILTGVILLWRTTVIKPLKIFAVFMHELGHSIMALIFGSGIQGFRINLDESGYAITMSKGAFSSFMIANGGYLGSVFFALLILNLKKTSFKKYILGVSAIFLLGFSIAYGKSLFTVIYASIFAGAVLILYMAHNEKLNDWVIDILGITCAAYAVYDTFVDTILLEIIHWTHLLNGWKTDQPVSDAVRLQSMTGVPAILWGIIWFTIACLALYSTIINSRRRRASNRS